MSKKKLIYIVTERASTIASASPYGKWALNFLGFGIANKLSEADAILFTGGQDITPMYYGEKKHKSTLCNIRRDIVEVQLFREALDRGIPMIGICRGAQLLTVLSGGSLIQDVNGHSSVDGHSITLLNRGVSTISSSHHQMMYPFDLPEDSYRLLGWSTLPQSAYYESGELSGLKSSYNVRLKKYQVYQNKKLPTKDKFDYVQASIDTNYDRVSPDSKLRRELAFNEMSMSSLQVIEPEIVYYKETNALAIQGHPERMDDHLNMASRYIRQLIFFLLHNRISKVYEPEVEKAGS